MSSPSMVAADGEWPPLPRGRTVDWVRGALAQRSFLQIRSLFSLGTQAGQVENAPVRHTESRVRRAVFHGVNCLDGAGDVGEIHKR